MKRTRLSEHLSKLAKNILNLSELEDDHQNMRTHRWTEQMSTSQQQQERDTRTTNQTNFQARKIAPPDGCPDNQASNPTWQPKGIGLTAITVKTTKHDSGQNLSETGHYKKRTLIAAKRSQPDNPTDRHLAHCPLTCHLKCHSDCFLAPREWGRLSLCRAPRFSLLTAQLHVVLCHCCQPGHHRCQPLGCRVGCVSGLQRCENLLWPIAQQCCSMIASFVLLGTIGCNV